MKRCTLTLAATAFQLLFFSAEAKAQIIYYPRGPMLNPPPVQPAPTITWDFPAPAYNPYVTPYPTYGILPPFLTARYGWDLSQNGYADDAFGRRTAEDYGYSRDYFDRQPRKRSNLYPAIPFKGTDDSRRARLEITVPADAVVLVDGVKTSQTGTQRVFYTPPLDPNHLYTSSVEVRWTDAGGKEQMNTKTFQFISGQTVTHRFTQ